MGTTHPRKGSKVVNGLEGVDEILTELSGRQTESSDTHVDEVGVEKDDRCGILGVDRSNVLDKVGKGLDFGSSWRDKQSRLIILGCLAPADSHEIGILKIRPISSLMGERQSGSNRFSRYKARP